MSAARLCQAPGCGKELPGRRRRFCSDLCRVRGQRAERVVDSEDFGRAALRMIRAMGERVGQFAGEYAAHHCPGRVTACKYCHEPVRVVNQPPGVPERLAVLDADEDPGGIVAVDDHGYAVHDPGYEISGARYNWHTKHETRQPSRAAEDFRSLMVQRPGTGRS